ncbi:MAG: enoyl-CoA hydratase/isomerase family protein [Peptococcaceae bacterium]|nr:enoyl-CoA hydratase/isomerase family protein [Peptococcaceae bacterium]
MYETIRYESSGGVATITLNRPDSLNSINHRMVYDLGDAFIQCRNDGDIRCVVLTGAGRGFCAGADLSAVTVMGPDDVSRTLKEGYNPVIKSIREIEKPVIAAVNGIAAGAGCSMALACDLVIAAESAAFVQAFVKIGLVPDAGGSYFLPRLVGPKKAMEMALLGEKISAAEAERLGMINRVVPDGELEAEVRKLAVRLASGPGCQGMIKTMFTRSPEMDLDGCLEMEADFQARAAVTEDFMEGVSAFLQKREAVFKGK